MSDIIDDLTNAISSDPEAAALMERARIEIESLRARVKELEIANADLVEALGCPICAGAGNPSGIRCACDGQLDIRVAFQYLNYRLASLAQLEGAAREYQRASAGPLDSVRAATRLDLLAAARALPEG